MSIDYKKWHSEAKLELQKLEERKQDLQRQVGEVDGEIAALIQTLNALAPLADEEPVPVPNSCASDVGITDRIRAILRESEEPMSPIEIRDRLEALGCDVKSYSNPLATIHTVLKRLVDSVEAKAVPIQIGGKKFHAIGYGAYGRGGAFTGIVLGRKKGATGK